MRVCVQRGSGWGGEGQRGPVVVTSDLSARFRASQKPLKCSEHGSPTSATPPRATEEVRDAVREGGGRAGRVSAAIAVTDDAARETSEQLLAADVSLRRRSTKANARTCTQVCLASSIFNVPFRR